MHAPNEKAERLQDGRFDLPREAVADDADERARYLHTHNATASVGGQELKSMFWRAIKL